jgi:hypothetical protein
MLLAGYLQDLTVAVSAISTRAWRAAMARSRSSELSSPETSTPWSTRSACASDDRITDMETQSRRRGEAGHELAGMQGDVHARVQRV